MTPINDLSKSIFMNLRLTYKKTPVKLLSKLTLKNSRKATLQCMKIANLSECVLLQTCNRVEFFAVTEEDPKIVRKAIINYWLKETQTSRRELLPHLEESLEDNALRHLLWLTTGLESMIVGENQILGQIRDSFNKSKSWGAIGPLLDIIFVKTIRAGGKIRTKTGINKGNISIGSTAVNLTEKKIADVNKKKIMILGAGETGTLIGKALASRGYTAIYVANRTHDRAKILARLLGGKVIQYNKINKFIPQVDVIFVATSAPHMTLKRKQITTAMQQRRQKKLLIFDLSQPRNVEPEISTIKHVNLLNIDTLQDIAKKNIQTKRKAMETAKHIAENELESIKIIIKRRRFESLISQICGQTEEIRKTELMKAFKLLGETDKGQRQILEKLTRVIVDKVLQKPVINLRKAAESGDTEIREIIRMIFGLEKS
ncbi:glutamyl-tRNA reductase [Candidatus Bathyarchaeota archaeon RBG_13_38_9]|nr:MAG: glutamyl-tRNA reductase [Candidatus Bathyarchaeota archaeon RBG_13_38_9]